MYYQALKAMEASRVALLAPVTALWLGYTFNDEPVTFNIWLGTSLILVGMLSYQWGRQWIASVARLWG